MSPSDPVIREADSQEEYRAALRVRIAVFVTEQGGPLEDEPDRWDRNAHHFVVLSDGQVVGTARIYQPEVGTTKVGRICLLPEYRQLGWGRRLLQVLIQAARRWGPERLVLDAQTHALPFYERFGFVARGEEFLDGGIPHRRMELIQPDTQ